MKHILTISTLSVLLAVTFAQHLPLPDLPYSYDALSPVISELTLRTHHLKHHAAYTRKVNAALATMRADPEYKALAKSGIDNVLAHLSECPDDLRETIKNNGGGYVNHDLFWKVMKPADGTFSNDNAIGDDADDDDNDDSLSSISLPVPSGPLLEAISESFGSFESFKERFSSTASSQFGSGWAWLYVDKDTKKLGIMSTSNQETPLNAGHAPILTLDVWEHAYYLDYKNDRSAWIEAWWRLVNWTYVESLYGDATGTLLIDHQEL